jgi:hypothetical protein
VTGVQTCALPISHHKLVWREEYNNFSLVQSLNT